MEEIAMLPNPVGGWVMMCPCGATEIRSQNGPRWAAFDLQRADGRQYRITCLDCGQTTEHEAHQ